MQGSDSSPPATVADNVRLDRLRLQLGPELRAMYPVVLNLGISGDLLIDGPADPNFLRLAGTMHLDSGEVQSLGWSLTRLLASAHSIHLSLLGNIIACLRGIAWSWTCSWHARATLWVGS